MAERDDIHHYYLGAAIFFPLFTLALISIRDHGIRSLSPFLHLGVPLLTLMVIVAHKWKTRQTRPKDEPQTPDIEPFDDSLSQ